MESVEIVDAVDAVDVGEAFTEGAGEKGTATLSQSTLN